MVRMCDDCRVDAVMNAGLDPYAGPGRAAPRTTEDYLRERQPSGDDEVAPAATVKPESFP